MMRSLILSFFTLAAVNSALAMDMSEIRGLDSALKSGLDKLSPLSGLEFVKSHEPANLYQLSSPNLVFPHERLLRQLYFSKNNNHILLRSIPSLGFQRVIGTPDLGIILRHVYLWEQSGKTVFWSAHRTECEADLLEELATRGSFSSLKKNVQQYIQEKNALIRTDSGIKKLSLKKKSSFKSSGVEEEVNIKDLDRQILVLVQEKEAILKRISGLKSQIPFQLKSTKRAGNDFEKVALTLKTFITTLSDCLDPEKEVSAELLPADFVYKALLGVPWKDATLTKADWLEYFRQLESEEFHPLQNADILGKDSQEWLGAKFSFSQLTLKAETKELTREENLFYLPVKNFSFPSFTGGTGSIAASVSYDFNVFGDKERISASYPPCGEDALYGVFQALSFNFNTGEIDPTIFSRDFFPKLHPLFETYLSGYMRDKAHRADNWQQLTVELSSYNIKHKLPIRAPYIKPVYSKTGSGKIVAYSEIRPGSSMLDFLFDLTGVKNEEEFRQRLNLAFKTLGLKQQLDPVDSENYGEINFSIQGPHARLDFAIEYNSSGGNFAMKLNEDFEDSGDFGIPEFEIEDSFFDGSYKPEISENFRDVWSKKYFLEDKETILDYCYQLLTLSRTRPLYARMVLSKGQFATIKKLQDEIRKTLQEKNRDTFGGFGFGMPLGFGLQVDHGADLYSLVIHELLRLSDDGLIPLLVTLLDLGKATADFVIAREDSYPLVRYLLKSGQQSLISTNLEKLLPEDVKLSGLVKVALSDIESESRTFPGNMQSKL